MRCYFSILLLSGLCWTSQYTEIREYEGRSVSHDCHYRADDEGKQKYFCRVEGSSCAERVGTAVPDTWVQRGRFSVFDNTSAHVFTLHITDLSYRDSGLYQCIMDGNASVRYSDMRITVLGAREPEGQTEVNSAVLPWESQSHTSFLLLEQRRETTVQAEMKGKRQVQNESHFRFWSVMTVICVGMLIFVCVFTIIKILQLINIRKYSGNTSVYIREPCTEDSEYDYVTMITIVTQTSLPTDQEGPADPEPHPHPQLSNPRGVEPPPLPEPPDRTAIVSQQHGSDVNPYAIGSIAAEGMDTDSDYMDLTLHRQSNVYEHLQEDTRLESIYHTLTFK